MSHFMKPPARPAPKTAPVVPAPAAPASTKQGQGAIVSLLIVIGVLGLVLMVSLAGDAGTLWGVIVIAWLLAPWVCMPLWSKKGGHPFTGSVMGFMLGPLGYLMLLLTPGTMHCANCGLSSCGSAWTIRVVPPGWKTEPAAAPGGALVALSTIAIYYDGGTR